MKLPDTNVLLLARDEDAVGHASARPWLEATLRGSETVGFAWVVLLGFLRIATNPRVYQQPLTSSQAIEQIQEWMAAPVATTVEPGSEHVTLLGELLDSSGTAGNLTTDAHLAALAIENGATLASFDGDFHRFTRLRLEHLR